jgi:hypothetical protein
MTEKGRSQRLRQHRCHRRVKHGYGNDAAATSLWRRLSDGGRDASDGWGISRTFATEGEQDPLDEGYAPDQTRGHELVQGLARHRLWILFMRLCCKKKADLPEW